MTRFCLPNKKQIKERRRKIFLNATMGVGVSRVTSISPFDDLWRGAILFFSSLSTCLPWSALFFFFLQKCAAVNTNPVQTVNYSSHPRQGRRPARHWIAGPCQRGDPPSLITNVIVQASPYRWNGSHAENSAARNECHVGRGCTRPQQRI